MIASFDIDQNQFVKKCVFNQKTNILSTLNQFLMG